MRKEQGVFSNDELSTDQLIYLSEDEAIQDIVCLRDGVLFQVVNGINRRLDGVIQISLDNLVHYLLVDLLSHYV